LTPISLEGIGLSPSDFTVAAGLLGRKGVGLFGALVVVNSFMLGFTTGYWYTSLVRFFLG
jgi:hypothetical protein